MNEGHRIEHLEQRHLPDAATREALLATVMTVGVKLTYAHLGALDLAA
jgi:hypothetical protein